MIPFWMPQHSSPNPHPHISYSRRLPCTSTAAVKRSTPRGSSASYFSRRRRNCISSSYAPISRYVSPNLVLTTTCSLSGSPFASYHSFMIPFHVSHGDEKPLTKKERVPFSRAMGFCISYRCSASFICRSENLNPQSGHRHSTFFMT